ncbi:MAG: glycerate kinase [Calditrichia bacterium]
MELVTFAQKVIKKALQSVHPDQAVKDAIYLNQNKLHISDKEIDLKDHDGIYVIGMGKAGAGMAKAVEDILLPHLIGGFVITKYEHTVPTQKIEIAEAAHPVSDENTLVHTRTMLDKISGLSDKTLILTLISGGGSALLELLPDQISLQDYQKVVKELLACGADITEINTIRKHLSRVKGGQLLRQIYPRTNISLIISDVIGDPVDFIASGPTAPDSTTFRGAWNIIQSYQLTDKLPEKVIEHLKKGVNGDIPDTPKASDVIFDRNHNIIIANNLKALKVMEKEVREAGFKPVVLGNMIEGEAREVGIVLAGIAKSIEVSQYPESPPAAVIFGGETTVVLKGDGKGGRNQELAVSFLNHLTGFSRDFVMVACGTDGTDGPTDAAGGIVQHEHFSLIKERKLNPDDYLNNNNCYYFLKEINGLLMTGPTQTNVMDINLLLIQ